MENWPVLLILVPVAIWVFTRFKVAGEHERFAVVSPQGFTGLKGPGFAFQWSGGETQWLRIRLGDRGELLTPGVARFAGTELPVSPEGDVDPLKLVRITGFTAEGQQPRILVALDPNQRREVQCEKCGHVMEVE